MDNEYVYKWMGILKLMFYIWRCTRNAVLVLYNDDTEKATSIVQNDIKLIFSWFCSKSMLVNVTKQNLRPSENRTRKVNRILKLDFQLQLPQLQQRQTAVGVWGEVPWVIFFLGNVYEKLSEPMFLYKIAICREDSKYRVQMVERLIYKMFNDIVHWNDFEEIGFSGEKSSFTFRSFDCLFS